MFSSQGTYYATQPLGCTAELYLSKEHNYVILRASILGKNKVHTLEEFSEILTNNFIIYGTDPGPEQVCASGIYTPPAPTPPTHPHK